MYTEVTVVQSYGLRVEYKLFGNLLVQGLDITVHLP